MLFIKDLFEHTFDKSIIMGRSIQYKLGKNFAVNEEAIANSYDELAEADPLVLLNKIKEIR